MSETLFEIAIMTVLLWLGWMLLAWGVFPAIAHLHQWWTGKGRDDAGGA